MKSASAHNRILLTLIIFFSLIVSTTKIDAQPSQIAENVITVVIDGARYSETFGDSTKFYTPVMWELAEEGTIISSFYNDGFTYTSRAVPALWCGGWTEVYDTVYNGQKTQYTELPSIFEYVRKQKNIPPEKCVYTLKSLKSLWLPSFDPDYGENYWPMFHSIGSTDSEVADEALKVMSSQQPKYLHIYFADVDHDGHSGVWDNYVRAIEIADSLVGAIWQAVQADTFYADKTAMFVTNDHGRHDDKHGGFKGHGDGCDGCRHIQFLAIGKGVRKNYVSNIIRNTPDFAVTAAAALGVSMTKSPGKVIEEIFEPVSVADAEVYPMQFKLYNIYPNPFNPSTNLKIEVYTASEFKISLFSSGGEKVSDIFNGELTAGTHLYSIRPESIASGIYFIRITSGSTQMVKKILYLR